MYGYVYKDITCYNGVLSALPSCVAPSPCNGIAWPLYASLTGEGCLDLNNPSVIQALSNPDNPDNPPDNSPDNLLDSPPDNGYSMSHGTSCHVSCYYGNSTHTQAQSTVTCLNGYLSTNPYCNNPNDCGVFISDNPNNLDNPNPNNPNITDLYISPVSDDNPNNPNNLNNLNNPNLNYPIYHHEGSENDNPNNPDNPTEISAGSENKPQGGYCDYLLHGETCEVSVTL